MWNTRKSQASLNHLQCCAAKMKEWLAETGMAEMPAVSQTTNSSQRKASVGGCTETPKPVALCPSEHPKAPHLCNGQKMTFYNNITAIKKLKCKRIRYCDDGSAGRARFSVHRIYEGITKVIIGNGFTLLGPSGIFAMMSCRYTLANIRK